MSDTRRRRKTRVSGDSDDLSDSYDELNVTKETQSSERTEDQHDSEYDTVDSDSDDSESQDGGLRESGDGQEEEKPQKKLDDDEDRRNPQYIPKRGTFYEHDDRTTEEVTDNAAEVPAEREVKEKKVWKDKEDRWDHDRYNDEEQAPKSHEELIAVYGYDIRNEEGPPRARRRRRYGRGPNKYTRNWEDENAYGKSMAGSISSNKNLNRRSNRTGGEEFPALNAKNKETSSNVEEPVISSAWYSNKNKAQGKSNFPPLQFQQEHQKAKQSSKTTTNQTSGENKVLNETNNPTWKKESTKHSIQHQHNSPNGNDAGGGIADSEKNVTMKHMQRDNKRQIHEKTSGAVNAGTGRVRGRGFKANANNNVINRVGEFKPKGRGAGQIIGGENKCNVDEQLLIHEMKQMSTADATSYHHTSRQNKHFYAQSSSQQRTNTVSSRVQQTQQQQQQPQIHQQQQQPPDASGNRPKRYSSLRQRPTITEGPTQQNYQPQQHGYYPTQAGNSRAVLDSQGYAPPPPPPQSHFDQTPSVAAATAPMTPQPVISMAAGAPPGAPSYAPPPFLVPPPQFIPQPQTAPPNIINYVTTPNGPPFQPNYQGYQGYNPAAVQQGPPPPPPQELFQPQGCTYYNPAQQQQQQQQPAAPLRRQKVAIPILPPPENQQQNQQLSGKGRGRNTTSPQQQQRPGGSSQPQQTELTSSPNAVLTTTITAPTTTTTTTTTIMTTTTTTENEKEGNPTKDEVVITHNNVNEHATDESNAKQITFQDEIDVCQENEKITSVETIAMGDALVIESSKNNGNKTLALDSNEVVTNTTAPTVSVVSAALAVEVPAVSSATAVLVSSSELNDQSDIKDCSIPVTLNNSSMENEFVVNKNENECTTTTVHESSPVVEEAAA